MRPVARCNGLLVRELGAETVVYDRERHQAHCLNGLAAVVFKNCDGTRSAEEIAGLLSQDADAGERRKIVRIALEGLTDAGLLMPLAENTHGRETRVGGIPRRALLRLGALAAPAVVSIAVPTPAQAASPCIPALTCAAVENRCLPCNLLSADCSDDYVCDYTQPGDTCVPWGDTSCP